ncbi:response regulator [Marinagarivorans cellulosilyticus]|uniref:Response regulatory domain-containing protein n=1 Tax=Marinagarivorans cellulosilyticus TaxID=2721545 RepID=A0AAN2BKC4_9GAMM|nr:response regulator [Marinagarivorans cellulosilyticus]BCD97879.1 hypothetical protein MARGE09_P2080 [Marinagarivorans cellulosilyticus]
MTNTSIKILIVDDNEDNCELLEDIFEQYYAVQSVFSGPACLDAMADDTFDLVLLDINMPNMDGYQVCQKIKQDPNTALTPVIFVSALASTEERLKGYEFGAEDYITKPFKAQQLKDTVTKVLEHRLQTKNIEKQGQEAMSTAFQAMSTSAELGQIIQFMQASYECKSVEKLAQSLLSTLSDFGLNGCLMFRMHYHTGFYGCDSSSIEAKVFARCHQAGRILDFGARTLINDPNISILVRNMPVDKPDAYGRIKDNLVALLTGTQARCSALEIEHQLESERKRALLGMLQKSQGSLSNISELVHHQKQNTQNVLLSINQKIEHIIFGLGLDEAQEQALMVAIDKGVEELNQLTEYSDQIETTFHGFVEELDILVNQ